MQGRAKLLGHSIHPMLVTFPLALLLLVAPFDLVFLITRDPFWGRLSFWLCTVGIVSGLVAAVPGFVDFIAIPRRMRAYRVALYHLFANAAALGFFIISWFAREYGAVHPRASAFILSTCGFLILVIGGWLGGELVEQHGLGVRNEAHLDAPSSLDANRSDRNPQVVPFDPDEPRPA